MTVHEDELRLRELLAPLERVEPVALRAGRRLRRRRFLLGGLVAAGLLVLGGAALAGGVDPFAGIGAADHPQSAQAGPGLALDKLARLFDGAEAAMARHTGGPAVRMLPGTARFIRRLPGGGRVYVLTDTRGDLCVFVEGTTGSDSCGRPLTQSSPTTLGQSRLGPSAPPVVMGVARNDVVSVSFRAGGRRKTVPVVDNVWVYKGENGALASLTLHFADGRSRTITPSRPRRRRRQTITH